MRDGARVKQNDESVAHRSGAAEREVVETGEPLSELGIYASCDDAIEPRLLAGGLAEHRARGSPDEALRRRLWSALLAHAPRNEYEGKLLSPPHTDGSSFDLSGVLA